MSVELADARVPAAGDELRDHAEGEGRRGEDGDRAPPPGRGGPDARPAPRRADRASSSSPACSQIHVEVAVDRLQRRFGVDVDLHQPRVPYLETIRKESRAQGRYKKQTGGRGQFGDCHIVLEPIAGHEGYEFVDKIVGGVIPQGFRPAVDKGIQEAMAHGELAGAPVQGVRVLLVDGSYHTVDSSEMAFKIAGSMAFKVRVREGRPGAARADHGARGDRPRRHRRRRERRPQLAARPAARHGAEQRHDDDPGRGAHGGGAHVLAVAHLA